MILSGVRPAARGGADAAQDRLEAARNARDALEGGFIDGVHADGDAMEAGRLEGRGQESSRWPLVVSGQVERLARDGAQAGQLADQVDQARAAAAARRR